MQWLSEVLGQAVTGLLADVVLFLLAVAAAYGVRYIRLLSARLEQKSRHELGDAAIERVSHLAQQVVLATESVAAAAIRRAVADGKVERRELELLGQQAVNEVVRALNAEARQALQGAVGDVHAYVRRQIEATLQSLKAQGIIPTMDTLRQAPTATSTPSEAAITTATVPGSTVSPK